MQTMEDALAGLGLLYPEALGVWPGTVTLAQYEDFGEDVRLEVVDGIPVVSPSLDLLHQLVVANLLTVLIQALPPHLRALPAPVDWVLREDPLTVRQPDVVVVERSRIGGTRRLTAAPILAVEVLSPDSLERDVVTKRRQYAEAGLDHYWVVSPGLPQLVVYRRSPAGTLDETARATGDDTLTVTDPFPLTFRPLDLAR